MMQCTDSAAEGRRKPNLNTLFSVNPDGSRNAIHPADVRGRWQRRKQLLWVLLIGVYLAVPWLRIDGVPVLLLDIPARHFYLLGVTCNAQDFWYAFFFITGAGFLLFVAAGLFGRVWCGFACPQTVFLEGVFRCLERWIEGNAAQRARLDKAPLRQKFLRRGAKLTLYALVAAVVTHSFLGYFMPVEELLRAVTSRPGNHPVAFGFMVVATLLMFINFTWFREQLCIVVCPYGRLQGALCDPDTVLVGYDRKRGEPRVPVKATGGDCVDCMRCVLVCPTGIDIRNGAQMECVGCANCIDACNAVMSKLGRAPGLIRFDSQRVFEGGKRRFMRGRVVMYAVLLLLGIAAMALALLQRRPFEAALQRRVGLPYRVEAGEVRSTLELLLSNKLSGTRNFHVQVSGPAGAIVTLQQAELVLDSLADAKVTVEVAIPVGLWRPGSMLEAEVRCEDGNRTLNRRSSMTLLGPSVPHKK